MRFLRTHAIILRRTNYAEADRILSVLTPQKGKLSVIAKGVRRPKSKLAGGLELFSVCDLTIAEGRGDIGVVTGAQIKQFYGSILADYDRMQVAYNAIKLVSKATESVGSEEFYKLLEGTLISLNNLEVDLYIIRVWFMLNLEQLIGESINLETDIHGVALKQGEFYNIDYSERVFVAVENGRFSSDHIKFLRLAQQYSPPSLQKIKGAGELAKQLVDLFR